MDWRPKEVKRLGFRVRRLKVQRLRLASVEFTTRAIYDDLVDAATGAGFKG